MMVSVPAEEEKKADSSAKTSRRFSVETSGHEVAPRRHSVGVGKAKVERVQRSSSLSPRKPSGRGAGRSSIPGQQKVPLKTTLPRRSVSLSPRKKPQLKEEALPPPTPIPRVAGTNRPRSSYFDTKIPRIHGRKGSLDAKKQRPGIIFDIV